MAATPNGALYSSTQTPIEATVSIIYKEKETEGKKGREGWSDKERKKEKKEKTSNQNLFKEILFDFSVINFLLDFWIHIVLRAAHFSI